MYYLQQLTEVLPENQKLIKEKMEPSQTI